MPFKLSGSIDGALTFRSTVPVAVTALRGLVNERGDFLMTTLPVAPLGTTADAAAVVFPHFAQGGGWSTQIVLTNPTDLPLTGTVQFFGQGTDAGAAPLTMTVNGATDSTFAYNIAPRSTVRLTAADLSPDIRTGYVMARASGGSPIPSGLSIFSFVNEGVTVSEAGVPAQSTATGFRTYVEMSGTVRSGFAVANASDLPAQVTLEISDPDGTVTGLRTSVEIPRGGHLARFIDELLPLPAGFQGMLRIESTQPIASIGLRARVNERGDTLITAIPVSTTAISLDRSNLVFPLVVNGRGYRTDFVMFEK
jgi:hypothetical protein